jgi:hypothetical protein
MVHHPWIELYRARRSMRVLHTAPLPDGVGADAVAAAAAAAVSAAAPPALQVPGAGLRPIITTPGPRAPKLAPAAAARPKGGQEDPMARVDEGLHPMLHSAASSPCLGAPAVVRGQVAAAAAAGAADGPAGAPKITALGQLSRLAAPAAAGAHGPHPARATPMEL